MLHITYILHVYFIYIFTQYYFTPTCKLVNSKVSIFKKKKEEKKVTDTVLK